MSLQGRKPDRAPGTPVPRTAHAGGRRKDALPAPQARAPPTARGSQGGVFLLSSSLRRRAGPHRRVSPSSCRRGPFCPLPWPDPAPLRDLKALTRWYPGLFLLPREPSRASLPAVFRGCGNHLMFSESDLEITDKGETSTS